MCYKIKDRVVYMWKENFAGILKWTFTQYNINSVEFASEIHVTESAIRQWQTGRNFPSKAALDELYPALEATAKQFETPVSSAQVKKYISEMIPSADDLIVHSKNSGDLIVNALKLCYTNHKADTRRSNAYASTGQTKAVVFDFDGTLTESHATKTTWESIWIALGYDVEECRTLHSRFDNKEFSHEEWCRLTTEKFLERKLHSDTMHEIAAKISLIDGCEEVFKKLQSHSIKIYIVSGSILMIIKDVLGALSQYVDAIQANDVTFSQEGYFNTIIGTKYDFEGKATFINEIADHLRISTSDILFVGNSYNDKYACISGATTLCINPTKTDPSNKAIWKAYIQDCTNLTQIFPFINM